MRLTSFTDFGLRALMRAASEPDRVFTTDEIAQEFGVCRNHLIKVVRELSGAGFVTTHRGTGGGFQLARPAENISIGDVVRSLEKRQALVECFREDGGDCVLTPQCKLKYRLSAARKAFLTELDKSSLAECTYPSPRRTRAVKSDA